MARRIASQWLRALREISRPFKIEKPHTKRVSESRRRYTYYPRLRVVVYHNKGIWNPETQYYDRVPNEGAPEALKTRDELFLAWNLFADEFLDSCSVYNNTNKQSEENPIWTLIDVEIVCYSYCSAIMPDWLTNDVVGIAEEMYKNLLAKKRPEDLHSIFHDALQDAEAPEMAMIDPTNLWPTAAVIAVCRSES